MSTPERDDPAALEFLTTREVADLLRVKERKVYDLAAAGEIPHRRITGKLLFPRAELRDWLDGGSPVRAERPAVVSGSHDPLLDWALRESGAGLATLFNGSTQGLEDFAASRVALAGMHIPEAQGWNLQSVLDRQIADCVLIGWALRARGLIIRTELSGEIESVADLKSHRIARRQDGSGAAAQFAKLCAEAGLDQGALGLGDSVMHTEADAASAVAAGHADAALGIEAMARQFSLGFVPLVTESFDLLIDRRFYFEAPVQKLLAFARTPEFAGKADEMGGYDLSPLGQVRLNAA